MSLFWAFLFVLLVLWLLGFFVFSVGKIIHILLVIFLLALVWNLVTGRNRLP